jgi:hypothetical protein
MLSRSAWTRPRIALLAAAFVLALLALGQLLLPGLAADRVRDELGDDRARVEVEAFPAWKLVFGRADRLTVSTPTVGADRPTPLGELLERAKGVGETDARIDTIAIDELRLRDVRVRIADGRVRTDAALSIRALSAMVPGGGALTPLASRPTSPWRSAPSTGGSRSGPRRAWPPPSPSPSSRTRACAWSPSRAPSRATPCASPSPAP